MSIYDQFAARIIKEQALVIGPIAWEQANRVVGLSVSMDTHIVVIVGDTKEVLGKLVAQYEQLFGPASREVCRDAVRPLLAQSTPDAIPAVLQ